MTEQQQQEQQQQQQQEQQPHHQQQEQKLQDQSWIRGVLFGRSVRSTFCSLNVALVSNNNNDNEKKGEEEDHALIIIQFVNEPKALRSFCRRYCKLGDLVLFQGGDWKDVSQNVETEWTHPRLVVNLESPNQAEKLIQVEQVQLWSMKTCQEWQQRYNYTSSEKQNQRPVNKNKVKRIQQHDNDRSLGSRNNSSQEEVENCENNRHSGGGIEKRKQGEYVTNFLIYMIMDWKRRLSPPEKEDDETIWKDPLNWASGSSSSISSSSSSSSKADRTLLKEALDYLNMGCGVIDVAGGAGFVSMALGLAGIQSTIVDPRKNVGCLPGRDRKVWYRALKNQQSEPSNGSDMSSSLSYCQPVVVPPVRPYKTFRGWFGSPPTGVDLSFRNPDGASDLPICGSDMLENCSAIVALHPDEATDAVVDLAVKYRKPFVVVPCCVFCRLFPHRIKPNSGDKAEVVSTHEDLLEYLMAKDASIQKTTLPFGGANTVLWSTFGD